MTRFLFLSLCLMISSTCFAQKDVTKFMDIPVDGSKKTVVQKIKQKGFSYNAKLDCLEGEFNGRQVKIFVITYNNKVGRIVVMDEKGTDKNTIKNRYNRICKEMERSGLYMRKDDGNGSIYTIKDNEIYLGRCIPTIKIILPYTFSYTNLMI